MIRFSVSSRRDGRMPRDERGWRVAPAPDGRGMPDSPLRRPPHRSRGFVVFALVLLFLNFGSVLLVRPAGPPRVKVPFSPYFVSAVRAGRVASIASEADTIQGTFKVAVRFPAGGPRAQLTTLFSTEVPTFWNDNQLTALLQSHDVQINATSPTQGGSLLASVLLGFVATAGTALLSVGAYGLLFGWPFAAGFVALLFVHEMGHAIQPRREGVNASAAMFVPFRGAVISVKSVGRNALAETRRDGGPEEQAYDDLPKHRLYVGMVHLSLLVRSLAGRRAPLPAITS